MLPHEAQATMAKVLFFVFALSMVCINRAHSFESVNAPHTPIIEVSSTK
ncbi:MAG: hypothetical protein HN509_08565 [Halobacteriovoraceae bacterium]|jgi:hypothetical protein|nr:hypothetical protein [Halobacteriovoraceae bacterium]MBT5095072.1 hypothetical protein [Halobacteriovoraceae bacterium]